LVSGATIVKIRLPDGRIYEQTGKLDFVDNTVANNTDTMILRGVVPNPVLPNRATDQRTRALVDGEFVTVILEDARPKEARTIPRTAVLTDQGGDYVYVVAPATRHNNVACSWASARPR